MSQNKVNIQACKLTGLNPEVLVATGEALYFDDFRLFLKHKKEHYHDFFRGSKVEINGVFCDIIARLGSDAKNISAWFDELCRIRREEMQEFKEKILNIESLTIYERLATDFPAETLAYQSIVGFIRIDWQEANELYIKFSKQKIKENEAQLEKIKSSSPDIYNKGMAELNLRKEQLEQYIETLAK